MTQELLKQKELRAKLIEVISSHKEELENLDSAWDFAYDFHDLTIDYKPEDMASEEFKKIAFSVWNEL